MGIALHPWLSPQTVEHNEGGSALFTRIGYRDVAVTAILAVTVSPGARRGALDAPGCGGKLAIPDMLSLRRCERTVIINGIVFV